MIFGITKASIPVQTKAKKEFFNSNNFSESNKKLFSKISNAEFEEELPTIHRIEELCQKLSSILDLDEIDAHIYLNLLRMGPVTASALARELHIDRTKAYRTIDKLLNLKIVSTTLSKPKLCVANKPEEVLQAILQKKEGQISKIKNSQNEIIENIRKTIPTNYESNLPRFHIAQGTAQIYSEIEKIVENATDTVYIITTMKDIAKMYHTTIPEKIQVAEKNGSQVRLLTEISDYDMLNVIQRFGATETKIGKLRSRGRIVVEKNKKMILSDAVSDAFTRNVESDFAICTDSAEMISNIYTLCSLLWNSSKPLKIPNIQAN